jgi:hypothetical protein
VGIAKQIQRQCLMHRFHEWNKQQRQCEAIENLPTVPFEEEETLPATSPNQHHHISMDNRQKVQVVQWVDKNKKDPAVKVRCHTNSVLFNANSHSALGLYTTPQESPLITS